MSARARRRTAMRMPAVIEADNGGDGELMPAVYVGRLRSSADWARELSRLYRQMRKGEVPLAAGSRLAFVGRIAAMQTRLVEELEQYREALLEWRRAHSDGGTSAPLPELGDPFEVAVDLLPNAAEQSAMQSTE